ncbi:hypothetical protein, partial [Stenotrophomonas maltophilia]|uniref:hypothetical protein n=1 Tax=Stenotrophomonas maltophilia TaxID=40324 RepID=UPI0025538EE9
MAIVAVNADGSAGRWPADATRRRRSSQGWPPPARTKHPPILLKIRPVSPNPPPILNKKNLSNVGYKILNVFYHLAAQHGRLKLVLGLP